jgi:hypothetical protein
MKNSKSLFGRLNNEVRRNFTRRSRCCEGGSADKATAFHRSSLREKALPKNASRPNLCALCALSGNKNNCVNLCKSVKSVVKNLSIKNNKLCKTNPISEKPKMNLTHYMTKYYENKSPLRTMEKQTQSNPILSALGQLALCHIFSEVGDYYISPGSFD